MSPQSDLEKARQIISLLLEVLGGLGLPSAGIARAAVKETARYLEQRERAQRLAEALRQAEEDFRAAARERGWSDVADASLCVSAVVFFHREAFH
jgi:Tfp pilus assembly protein PilX